MTPSVTEASIYETRNNFSAIIDDIVSGRVKEHIVKKRDKPVVKLSGAESRQTVKIGAAKDVRFLSDDDALDKHNDEIAALFGV